MTADDDGNLRARGAVGVPIPRRGRYVHYAQPIVVRDSRRHVAARIVLGFVIERAAGALRTLVAVDSMRILEFDASRPPDW